MTKCESGDWMATENVMIWYRAYWYSDSRLTWGNVNVYTGTVSAANCVTKRYGCNAMRAQMFAVVHAIWYILSACVFLIV